MTIEEHNVEQRSAAWYELRRGKVTASSVGSLLTISRLGAVDYTCPTCGADAGAPCLAIARRESIQIKSVHAKRTEVALANRDESPLIVTPATNDDSRALTRLLVAERIAGWVDETYTSNDMWQGIIDEPIARDLYAETYAPVREVGFVTRDDWGFTIGFSPDGLVGTAGSIEVKSRRAKKHIATILADEVPVENLAQIHGGMLVRDLEWCDYLSFCGGLPMWHKRVFRDPSWDAAIVEAVQRFENDAAQQIDHYYAAVEGLPMTERIDHDTAGITF